MRKLLRIPNPVVTRSLMVGALAFSALAVGRAEAVDLLGVYVGGAIGQSQVAATANSTSFALYGSNATGEFKQDHLAFKVMVGIRPISPIGAELEYVDLGHPSGSLFDYPADASVRGAAAFGVLYLPVPIVDIFIKAGAARLQSSLSGVVPYLPICSSCVPPRFEQDRTDTHFAAGAGAQFKFGAWAVRAEYERFNAAGGNPSLVSAGITRRFL
jgi:opacity protein-like surface antigen